jgi:hypothetical protein
VSSSTPGCIRHANAALRARGNVDVVVADRDVGDDLEIRTVREDRLVEAIHHRRHGGVLALEASSELLRRPRTSSALCSTSKRSRERLDDLGEDRPV